MSTTSHGFPWDGDDRSFLASDIAASWAATYSNGAEDAENDFPIIVPDPTKERITIGAGSCRINGRRKTLTSPKAVTIPGENGTYTPGYFQGSICIKANEVTRDFEIVTHYVTDGRHPAPESDEILIAEFYYWRPLGQMSTDVVVRRVNQSEIVYPQRLTGATAAEMSGLLKGVGGLLAAAVPYTDYLPGSAAGKEDLPVQLNAGIIADSASTVRHYRLMDMHIVMFRIGVTWVPSSAEQVTMTLPPPNQTGAVHGGGVIVTRQTTAEATLYGATEYDPQNDKQLAKLCTNQQGTPLTVSALQQGNVIEGVVFYY